MESPRSEYYLPTESSAESRDIETVKTREEAVTKLKNFLRQKLEERFGEKGEETLPFHSPAHSENVRRLSLEFLEIIKNVDPNLVTDNDLGFIEIEALAHDLRQDTIPPRPEAKDVPQKTRRRKRGAAIGNENASAQEFLTELAKYVYPDGRAVFPTNEKLSPKEDEVLYESVINDIGATFPDFMMAKLPDGTMGLKIFQPYLVEQSSLCALALASADLRGAVGADNFTTFREEGDAEFREVYKATTKDASGDKDKLAPERRAEIANEILGWKKTQISFAKWQQILFEESLDQNARLRQSAKFKEIKEALKQRYAHFDDNIRAAAAHYAELEQQFGALKDLDTERKLIEEGSDLFEKLLLEIGYSPAAKTHEGTLH